MALACSGLPAVARKKNFPKSHTLNPLLTKFVQSPWLDIDLIPFLQVYGPWSQSINTQTWPISNHLDLTLGQ